MDKIKKSNENYEAFRECISNSIVQKSVAKPPRVGTRRKLKGLVKGKFDPQSASIEENTPEELAEFIDYIARETFDSLPDEFQSLSFSAIQKNSSIATAYADPIPRTTFDALITVVPLSVPESLSVYGLIPDPSDFSSFLQPVLSEYISTATAGPPVWNNTRTSACEICERDWIPLTYHHLIPKGVHAKVLKKRWHEEWSLNSVAWLCRACHNFVHRMASNEELAKEWYTVERILQRDDVQDWARWVGRIRWKAQ